MKAKLYNRDNVFINDYTAPHAMAILYVRLISRAKVSLGTITQLPGFTRFRLVKTEEDGTLIYQQISE